MVYTKTMKKAEFIAKYGAEKYAEMLAKQQARRATPEGREKHAAYMNQWYHANQEKALGYIRKRVTAMSDEERAAFQAYRRGVEKRWRDANPERARAISAKAALVAYHRLSPEEKRALYEKRYAARRAKIASDKSFA